MIRLYSPDDAIHPQDLVSPLINNDDNTTFSLPQSHLHFHATRFIPELYVLLSALSTTVSIPNLRPVKSFISVVVQISFTKQPQDFVFPCNKELDLIIVSLPQSHLHFQATHTFPDGETISSTRSKTVSLPNL